MSQDASTVTTPSKEELRRDMNEARQYLLATIARVPEAMYEQAISAEGWTVRQTLAHLAGAEPGMTALCRRIQAGEGGASPDLDLQRYNARQVEKRSALSVAELLAALAESRQDALAALEEIPTADLVKSGLHPVGGERSIAEIFQIIARHERAHAGEIERGVLN